MCYHVCLRLSPPFESADDRLTGRLGELDSPWIMLHGKHSLGYSNCCRAKLLRAYRSRSLIMITHSIHSLWGSGLLWFDHFLAASNFKFSALLIFLMTICPSKITHLNIYKKLLHLVTTMPITWSTSLACNLRPCALASISCNAVSCLHIIVLVSQATASSSSSTSLHAFCANFPQPLRSPTSTLFMFSPAPEWRSRETWLEMARYISYKCTDHYYL